MKRIRYISLALLPLAILLAAILAGPGQRANAGPQIIGEQAGATVRALVSQDDQVKRIVYFDAGAKTMANTTPVASDPVCGLNGTLHKAEVQLVGTMGGTNPTLTILWQNSLDGGTTWTSVGTWTAINATVTPATQSQTVADLVASTAVAFGDCWRATYTFGGTGTVTANISIKGIEK